MRRNRYKIYAVLGIGLLMLFLMPVRLQNILRNQFLRPIIPLGSFVTLKPARHLKKYPQHKVEESFTFVPSYPGGSLAKILYRNPSSWNDFFWINLGKNSNRLETKITVNSPVLYDGALVGVVDYVGKKQSRVQLITNANLTISVRALRGKEQYPDLLNHIQALQRTAIVQENQSLVSELSKLEASIQHESMSWYLAKGELSGTSEPLWRTGSQILIGKGFNCEYEDALSSARDLVTGLSVEAPKTQMPILMTDDLLVTTGLDGVFPEGLQVARVDQVDPLVEGAYYYSLKAKPICMSLKDLHFVEVILPIDFKEEKVPLRAFAD